MISIRAAVNQQIATYANQNFSVKTILVDGEEAITSMSTELQGRGIAVNLAGLGQHVLVAERKIREIKEQVRGAIGTTPWIAPRRQLPHLVQFAAASFSINLTPNIGDILTVACPRVAFVRIQTDHRIHVRDAVGDYCDAV